MSKLKRVIMGALILLVLFYIPRLYYIIMFDRQLIGQFRRLLVAAPKQHFDNKYQTPHFRQHNLRTKTNRLHVCRWLEGMFAKGAKRVD